MKRLKLFSGSSHADLAGLIAAQLGCELGRITISRFANSETMIELNESVRGADVYIVQTSCHEVNECLMELLLIIQTCRLASAWRINVVLPNFPYARQDKLVGCRGPISAKLVADMLTVAGANHIITMDLHASQIQGFFDIPVENLSALPAFVPWIQQHVDDWKESVIISPDAGGSRRATALTAQLNVSFAMLHKERRLPNEVSAMTLVGNVHNKTCIIVDDIADTCHTLRFACQQLRAGGAKRVFGIATHGVLSRNGLNVIREANLEAFVITNTLPHNMDACTCSNVYILDVSNIFSEFIQRNHADECNSQLSLNDDRHMAKLNERKSNK